MDLLLLWQSLSSIWISSVIGKGDVMTDRKCTGSAQSAQLFCSRTRYHDQCDRDVTVFKDALMLEDEAPGTLTKTAFARKRVFSLSS
jgi:hypothetical protein